MGEITGFGSQESGVAKTSLSGIGTILPQAPIP